MPDFERRRNRRFVLPCENCGRRIASTRFDPEVRSEGDPFIAGHPLLPWRWQGVGPTPIRYFEVEGVPFVGVVCRACGRVAVYPDDAVPSRVTF